MITNGNAEVAKSTTNGNTIAEAPSSADEMNMEVDPSPSSSSDMGNSVLSNPARYIQDYPTFGLHSLTRCFFYRRFDKLIRFGQTLQTLLTDLETARGIKDERNGRLLQVRTCKPLEDCITELIIDK